MSDISEPAVETGDSSGAGAAQAMTPEAAPAGAEAASEVEQLRAALSAAEETAKAQREQYLRSVAELDNVRKRAQRDVENAHRYAAEGFASEMLAVRDSLELGVRSGASADAATLLAGQEATLKLVDKAFEKFAVKAIEPVGKPFDPNLHEAMLMQPSTEAAPGTVLQVVQTGYEVRGRLLRPARVIVAKAADD